jgi:two-component system chemotaxis response regulator CheY
MFARKPRIVLADDEIHIRYLIRNVMLAEGYEVAGEVNNGEDAVAMYREVRPDLIVMDINLPLKTGDVVLADILGEFPDAKVVMLTMVADIDTVKRCLELGAVDYILKSNPVEEIKRILRGVVASLGIEEVPA